MKFRCLSFMWLLIVLSGCGGETSLDNPSSRSTTISSNTGMSSSVGGAMSLVIEDGEQGYCAGLSDAKIATDNPGFSGSGYLDTPNAANTALIWRVKATEASTYEMKVRYANGTTTSRSAQVLVNNVSSALVLNMEPTESWTSWREASVNVVFSQGVNTLKISAISGDGLPNIDWLKLTGAKLSAEPCNDLPIGSSSLSSSATLSSSSSSSSNPLGDPVAGGVAWQKPPANCHFCHSENGDGTGGIGDSKIDPRNLKHTTRADLVNYIATQMPKGRIGDCTGECAENTAAYFLSWTSTGAPSSSTSSSSSSGGSFNQTGAEAYAQQCLACHGVEGKNPERPILPENWTRSALVSKIDVTMPLANPSMCKGECANRVADYILSWKPTLSCQSSTDSLLSQRLRLLTNHEYGRTANDLLYRSTANRVTDLFEANNRVAGYDNNAAAASVTRVKMSAYWDAALKLSLETNMQELMDYAGCTAQDSKDACATKFVGHFVKRAFRRPLTNDESTSYRGLFNQGNTLKEGASNVVFAMLVSPNFLYRSEIGTPSGDRKKLTPHEVASLLSYTFWGSMPDALLMTAADQNKLGSLAELRAEVARLLAHNKAKSQISYFANQWLHIEGVAGAQRDKNLFPSFDSKIGAAMEQELALFLQELFLKDGYKTKALLNPGFTFVNDALAGFYGINGASGTDFTKVNNSERDGILSMGAVLVSNATATSTHPIWRGLLVRRNLLCQEFGAPPPNVGDVEPLNPNKPTRERFAAHTANENCKSCHQHIDQIGFAFENFDAVGRFRTSEGNGLTIDASGSISGLAVMTESDTHPFNNLAELQEILATEGEQQVAQCVTEQFHRFMHGVAEPDPCAVNQAFSRWQGGAGDLKQLLIEVVNAASFIERK